MFNRTMLSLRVLRAASCLRKVSLYNFGPCPALSVRLPKLINTSARHSVLPNDNHGDGKTTVTVMNQDMPDTLMINSYNEMGFRLNYDFFVVGPAVVFPKLVLQWNVGNTVDTITEESLSLFKTLDPPIDILIVGTGNADSKPDPKLIQYCLKNKINVEFLPTYQACTTFNFLNAEQRYVVAALIPPSVITYKHSLIALQRKRLLELGDNEEKPSEIDSPIKRL